MNNEELKREILKLKKERNAIILAHNYQLPEIQDIADFVGDSLGLSQQAAKTNADVIVFCGVHFMAETASILCPNKKVLLPDLNAQCSLADTITVEELRQWKAEHPDAITVCYINTSADIKAECDYCCTSSNAVKVVNSVARDKEILFLPDMFLGSYVAKVTNRKLYLWPGECHVHAGMRPSLVKAILASNPDAEFLIHPECGCTTAIMYYNNGYKGKFLSTEGMMRYAKESNSNKFIVATEVGILYRLQNDNPNKEFIPLSNDAICKYMKMITLDKVYKSLKDMVYEVKVNKSIADKARLSIERMLSIT
jgi:quinolinate synthase